MTIRTNVAVLPIGEFNSAPTRNAYEAIIRVFRSLDARLEVADPVSDEAGVGRVIEQLARNSPDLLLVVPLRGLSAPVIEKVGLLSPAPCLIWPIQGTFALPSSALAVGALRASSEMRMPVELFYAPPDDPGTLERIQCISRAARAFSRIRKSRIGVVGKLFPNLVSCRYDPQMIHARLGATLVPVDFQAVRDRLQDGPRGLPVVEPLRQAIASAYGTLPNAVPLLDAGLRLHLSLKAVAREQRLDGFATECWTGFPQELGLNPCLGLIEDDYALACEGDVMMCISLLIVRSLTGASAYNGDLFDLDLDGLLTLVHCGGPASLASDPKEVVVSPSQLAKERGFATVTCRPKLAAGRVTVFRFYGLDCAKMHLAAGDLVGCEQSPNLSAKIHIEGNRWDFLEQCLGNHYVVAAGDLRNELKLLSKWLGITVFET